MEDVRLQRFLRVRDFFPPLRTYNSSGRAELLVTRYGDEIVGDVLDVCCGSTYADLKAAFGARYKGLDIPDSYKYEDEEPQRLRPDYFCNVEREPLPFGDGAYDTVMCISALEHLDNIHSVYDELFRVARRRVIVMLPNNWVGFISSFLAGRNYTHRAGYGLGPEPKRPGERHKYFYNLEEAAEFLAGRRPAGWNIRRLDCSFERGADTWLAWRWYSRAATLRLAHLRKRFGKGSLAVAAVAKMAYYAVRPVEWLIGVLVWGTQGRVAYHNLMCREIWIVFDKEARTRA